MSLPVSPNDTALTLLAAYFIAEDTEALPRVPPGIGTAPVGTPVSKQLGGRGPPLSL